MNTYINTHNNIIINIDENENTQHGHHFGLEMWLEESHNDIFMDIEFFCGGSVKIDEQEIYFSGDNGVFILDRIKIKTIQ